MDRDYRVLATPAVNVLSGRLNLAC